jgi:hypothetical protein
MRCKKYYKNLFYGLLDMGIVNAIIVHKTYAASVGERPKSHADFLIQLHEELLMLTKDDFVDAVSDEVEEVVAAPFQSTQQLVSAYVIAKTTHTMSKSMDLKACGGFKFRFCKVCSILKSTGTTRFYCSDCSDTRGRIYLCNEVRRVDQGNTVSCFNIWHSMWKNGERLPDTVDRGVIRQRRSAEQIEIDEFLSDRANDAPSTDFS